MIGAGGAGGGTSGTDGGAGGITQITINGIIYSCSGGVPGVGTTTRNVQINAEQGAVSASVLALPCEVIYQMNGGVAFANSPQFAGSTGAATPFGSPGIGGRTEAGPVAASGYGSGGGGVGMTMSGGPGMPGLFQARWIS